MTLDGLTLMACESLGVVDLTEWYNLPPWVRHRWLAHQYAKVTGAYEPGTKAKTPPGSQMDADILAKIEAQRRGA